MDTHVVHPPENRILVVRSGHGQSAEKDMLGRHGFETHRSATSEDALRQFENHDYDAVVSDVDVDPLDGIALADRVQSNWQVPVILLSPELDARAAVAALRVGVTDLLVRPFPPDELVAALMRALKRQTVAERLKRLNELDVSSPIEATATHQNSQHQNALIGESAAIEETRNLIDRIAPTDISVLLTGESGTGKELAATEIHRRSQRRAAPHVAVNCSAIPATLLESELFGHVRGAFTDAREARSGLFVKADGGTVFLDEIGDMSLGLQTKLLRSLQEGRVRPVGQTEEVPFDARIIAATNRDLPRAVSAGTFREDLYYRLDVVNVHLPPLRDRNGDILLLANHFIERFAHLQGRSVRSLTPEAGLRLVRHVWPGNVRELANAMERAVALTQHEQITVTDLPTSMQKYEVERDFTDAVPDLMTLEDLERHHIDRVLLRVSGNKSAAAKILGIDRRTLHRKLRRYTAARDETAATGRLRPN